MRTVIDKSIGMTARIVVIVLFSLASAWLCALAFVAALNVSLPPTDSGYHQTLTQSLQDPAIWFSVTVNAWLFGIVAIPMVWFASIGKPLFRTLATILGAVLTEILLVTPFFQYWGYFLAPVALLLACAVFWLLAPPRRP